MVTRPSALTAAKAATRMPSGSSACRHAEAALQVGGGGARAGADGADRRVLRRRFAGGAAERRIEQRVRAQALLVAAIGEVEEARARHDRHADVADREAAALPGEPGHHAVGCRKPEGRAAGKHDGVDALDEVARREQVGLAARRRAARHVHRRDRRLFGQEDGDAGLQRLVGRVADQEAGKGAHPKRFGNSPSNPTRIR